MFVNFQEFQLLLSFLFHSKCCFCRSANMELVSASLQEEWMRAALEYARSALSAGEVPVGCVIVRHSGSTAEVVAAGHNEVNATLNATRHAELVALDRLAANFGGPEALPTVLAECILVVTVEPCLMCAAALRSLGSLHRLIFGCRNERFGGCGSVIETLRPCKPDVLVWEGVLKEEAVKLLQEFYNQENQNAPADKRLFKGDRSI